MKRDKLIGGMILALGLTMIFAGSVQAHNVFKKEMEKKYPNLKINCNACHVDKKPKTERNAFGNLFHKEMEAQEITKNWKEKKGSEKKDYETTVMAPAFDKALAKISAMTYDEIIKGGLVAGIEDPAAEKTNETVAK